MRVLAKLLAPLRRGWRPVAIVLLCAAAGLAQAQSAADDNNADPPSRVARLSYLSGDLGFLPAGAKNWSDANINRPLTTGDRLSTGRDSRAELELGGGTLRMAGQTNFGLLDLNDQLAQVELTQGTLNLTVRHLEQGQSYEIDTPTVALVVNQPGSFRVDIDDNGGSTQVTAFDGSATVYGENSAQRSIDSGRSYRFVDSSLAAVVISDIGGGDSFDAWNDHRNHRYAQSTSRRYVSDQVVGYQDLDQYGDWHTTSDYGAVWFPAHVAADWAPYRDGHWAYIAPWGWSWVDDSPWGFAPYHYGRWAYVSGDWGWIPGPIAVRPIYAPALVAFVGGGGWSVGISGGPVGWFPLGPGEIYNPWYRASRSYYTNVNVTNIRVTNVTNRTTIVNNINEHYGDYRDGRPVRGERYANRDAPRGFTAVPGNAFAGGRQVQRVLLHVDQRKLAETTVSPHGANLRPTAGSVAPPRSAHARALPNGGFNREVVARNEPPVARTDRVDASMRNPRGARQAVSSSSNVRLLTPRGVNNERTSALDGRDRAAVGRNGVDQARIDQAGTARPAPAGLRQQPADNRLRNQPGTSNVAATAGPAGTLPIVQPIHRTDLRAGELPSARYARPQAVGDSRGRGSVESQAAAPSRVSTNARMEQGQRAPQEPPLQQAPRPGVSYISPADAQLPSRTERGNRAAPEPLPQVPHFERAMSNNPPAAVAAPRAQQQEAERMTRRNAPVAGESMGNPAQPRVERAAQIERAAPQDTRMAPREMAPPRQAYEPPRREAAPAMPAPRAAPALREEPPTQRAAPKRADHPAKDERQN
jgi:hypothetical protein